MTNEEAIKWIERFELAFPLPIEDYIDAKEALDMAIKALEQTELEPSYNSVKTELVSREAVMKCFKKWQPYMATRLWDYEQELSKLPSVTPKTEWIPCSERLPEEDGCYLVTTTGTNNDIIDIAYYTEGIWHKASRIKAWMPLPEAFREEDTDD